MPQSHITRCLNEECSKRDRCYRFILKPCSSEHPAKMFTIDEVNKYCPQYATKKQFEPKNRIKNWSGQLYNI